MDRGLKIRTVSEITQLAARNVILEGFEERFGFIDQALNPDLENIFTYYNKDGHVFFVGILQGQVICTGALTKENSVTGRIERMSVKKSHRRRGIAKMMLQHLEEYAKTLGYTKIVLETNKEWTSAINLYVMNGYVEYQQDAERIHLVKYIS